MLFRTAGPRAALLLFVCLCISLHAYAVHNVKEVSQAETKGKSASEAPLKPSVWKGEQVGQLEFRYQSLILMCHFDSYA